ncbi:MAG: hypothetical protein V4654_08280 [Bdellovibrionota bacterium]
MKKIRLICLLVSFMFAGMAYGQTQESKPQNESFEMNIIWPFIPGGITELRYITPMMTEKGEVPSTFWVLGLYSDYASKIIRDSSYGKVSAYAFKIGMKQFINKEWHYEVSANIGWREEINRPNVPDKKIIGAAVRAWALFGYQHQISNIFYSNIRAGLSQHLYRSDKYSHLEKKTVPGFDVNLGVVF